MLVVASALAQAAFLNGPGPSSISPSFLSASPTWRAESGQADARFGSSVASAGDINGDGYADLIVGAPNFDNPATTTGNDGRAFVYLGSTQGPSSLPAWTADGSLGGMFGFKVSSAGDVNGDGYDDVIVGEPEARFGSTWGQVSIFLGSVSGLPSSPSMILYQTGDLSIVRFGSAVSSAGDVNGDGFDDVIIGMPGANGPGLVYLYMGSSSGLSSTPALVLNGLPTSLARFGASLAGAGDVNGDGFDDVIIGAPLYGSASCRLGRALVYPGSPTGLSTTPVWDMVGDADCGNLISTSVGSGVASAGDVDHDGYDEILVPGWRFGTKIFRGGPGGPGAGSLLTEAGAAFTLPAASAGDVDGDGYGDVAIGAAIYRNGVFVNNAVFIHLGSAAGLAATPALTVESDQPDAGFGFPVAGAGDTDGDGLANVLIGAPFYDDGGLTDQGAAFLLFGPPVSCIDADGDGYCATGPGADCDDSRADVHPDAIEVCNGLDDNCDGQIDETFAIGGPCSVGVGACTVSGSTACAPDGTSFCDAPPPGTPGTEICDGIDNDCDGVIDDTPAPCPIATGTQQGARLGNAVADAGDVNGDGLSDILVGAPGQGNGKVFLYYGSPAGIFHSPDWSAEGTQISDTVGGFVPGAVFGAAVAGAGDLNKDGFADFIVGAPGYHYESYQFYSGGHGAVYVYFGSPQGPVPGWFVEGPANHPPDTTNPVGRAYGASVAAAGDVDGDGNADVMVGIPVSPMFAPLVLPQVEILFGSPSGAPSGSTRITAASPNHFGRAVASPGDVDHDGHADLLIGARFEAFLYHGASSRQFTTAAWSASDTVLFGGSVATAGDVNHDGWSDILVGGARASLFLGSPTGPQTTASWTYATGQSADTFGLAVAFAGDLNLDGFDDALVGAGGFTGNQSRQGRALLFLGGPQGLQTTPFWVANPIDQDGASFGAALSAVADYNGDGLREVVVGTPYFDSSPLLDSGRADLFRSFGLTCEENPSLPACVEKILSVCIDSSGPGGKGSATVTWRSQREIDLTGFNVVRIGNQGQAVRLNAALIPCEECVSGQGHLYTFYLPKHKGSSHDLFIEMVRQDGTIEAFGPALKGCAP
jgi:hypothetical protein